MWSDLPPDDSFLHEIRTMAIGARATGDQDEADRKARGLPKPVSIRSLYLGERFRVAAGSGLEWPGGG